MLPVFLWRFVYSEVINGEKLITFNAVDTVVTMPDRTERVNF